MFLLSLLIVADVGREDTRVFGKLGHTGTHLGRRPRGQYSSYSSARGWWRNFGGTIFEKELIVYPGSNKTSKSRISI